MLREMRIEDCFHSFFTDCRFARRQLQKSPIFTTVAVLTLALGIGSSTAIFSTIDGTLLHPYPYKNAERLATFSVFSAEQFRAWRFPARAFVDFKGRNHTFDDMFGLVYREVRFTSANGSEEFSGGSDLWLPLDITRDTFVPGAGIESNEIWTVGHLKIGVSPESAAADLQVIASPFQADDRIYFPPHFRIVVNTLNSQSVGDNFKL